MAPLYFGQREKHLPGCQWGEKRDAANIVKLGVMVCIQDYDLRRVNDRMHRRYYKNLGFSSDTPLVKL